jgi:hypothetical protein
LSWERAKLTSRSIGECGLDGLRSYEASGAEDEFGSASLEFGEMYVDKTGYHLALSVTHGGHIDPEAIPCDAKLFTSAHVRCNLRSVNDVLAWQAGYVWA